MLISKSTFCDLICLVIASEYLRSVGTAPPLPREPKAQDGDGDQDMEEGVDQKPTIIEIDSDSDNEEREQLPSSVRLN